MESLKYCPGNSDTIENKPELMTISEEPTSTVVQKRRLMKNILILATGFLLNLTAYNGLGRLQSTLHHEEGIGVVTQGVVYLSYVLSCLLVPKIAINLMGQKWTICFCTIGYIIWMGANGYAVWGTMVTASVIVGICAGPLWVAQSSYVAKTGARYASLSTEDEAAVIGRFFGISFGFCSFGSILGSIVSFVILRQEERNHTSSELLKYCGANYCPWYNFTNTNMKKPEPYLLWTLVGTYIVIACAGLALSIVFLDKLPLDQQERMNLKELLPEIGKNLVATICRLRSKKQLLLLPITVYCGLQGSYYSAELTQSFVGCSMGTHMVGLVLFLAFIVGGVSSVVSGHLVKYTGRTPLFLTGFTIDLTNQMIMRFWQPDPEKLYVFFIISCCWGLSKGIWQSQVNGFYGVLFQDNIVAAFASCKLWQAIGSVMGYSWSKLLCTWQKLAILTAILCAGILGYLVVEIMVRKEKKKERYNTNLPHDNRI